MLLAVLSVEGSRLREPALGRTTKMPDAASGPDAEAFRGPEAEAATVTTHWKTSLHVGALMTLVACGHRSAIR